MFDLHTHILPMVDDGAHSLEQALEMLSIAYSSGTSGVVLTPHYMNFDLRSEHLNKEELIKRYNAFKGIAAERIPEIQLCFGAETFASVNLGKAIQNDLLITVNNTKYVLLEFDFDDDFYRALNVTFDLSDRGYIPIIAHPERYKFLRRNQEDIDDFIRSGALFQVNATSLGRHWDFETRNMASRLLKSGLISLVASDCHNTEYRTPNMTDAYGRVAMEYSKEYADSLFKTNPRLIVQGVDIRK